MNKITINKKILKITSIAVVAVLILASAVLLINSAKVANPKCYDKFFLSTFHGSYDKEGCPKTYYEVKQYVDEENDNAEKYQYIKIKFSSSTVATTTNSIWVNVSDLKTELKTTVLHTSSATYFEKASNMTKIGAKTITKEELKADEDGWIQIFSKEEASTSTLYSYFAFGFYGEARIREIAIVDSNGKLVEFTYKAMTLGDGDAQPAGLTGEAVTDEQDKTIWEKAE